MKIYLYSAVDKVKDYVNDTNDMHYTACMQCGGYEYVHQHAKYVHDKQVAGCT